MEHLINIQNKLKAPKNQENKFGGYKYRSCEDIMEALKPLLNEEKCVLVVKDDIVMFGNPDNEKSQCRFYVKAIATLFDESGKEIASTTAFAREPLTKKGQDESQITGAASSYARKYALNGLFCIDDTKDADTMDNRDDSKKISIMKERIKTMLDGISKGTDISAFEKYKDSNSVEELTAIGIAVKKLYDSQGE